MTREGMEDLEKKVMKELVRRRALGGYSADAEGILLLYECLFDLVRHLKEKTPKNEREG